VHLAALWQLTEGLHSGRNCPSADGHISRIQSHDLGRDNHILAIDSVEPDGDVLLMQMRTTFPIELDTVIDTGITT
jgi:hypothetical protein